MILSIRFMGLQLLVPRGRDSTRELHVFSPLGHVGTSHEHVSFIAINNKYRGGLADDCDDHVERLDKAYVEIVDSDTDGKPYSGGIKIGNVFANPWWHIFNCGREFKGYLRRGLINNGVPDEASSVFKLTRGGVTRKLEGAFWRTARFSNHELVPGVEFNVQLNRSDTPFIRITENGNERHIELRAVTKPDTTEGVIKLTYACLPVEWWDRPSRKPEPDEESEHLPMIGSLLNRMPDGPLTRYVSGKPYPNLPYRRPNGCPSPMKVLGVRRRGVDPYNCLIATTCPEEEPDCQ